MAQFLLFVYSLIIFLSLFLGEAAFERTKTTMCMQFSQSSNIVQRYNIICHSDVDCPMEIKPYYIRCVDGHCWVFFGKGP